MAARRTEREYSKGKLITHTRTGKHTHSRTHTHADSRTQSRTLSEPSDELAKMTHAKNDKITRFQSSRKEKKKCKKEKERKEKTKQILEIRRDHRVCQASI